MVEHDSVHSRHIGSYNFEYKESLRLLGLLGKYFKEVLSIYPEIEHKLPVEFIQLLQRVDIEQLLDGDAL